MSNGAQSVVGKFTTKLLEQAIAEVSNLPASDQEQIGRKLLSHVEKLRMLRPKSTKGSVRSMPGTAARSMSKP